jgi:hypothetical protein
VWFLTDYIGENCGDLLAVSIQRLVAYSIGAIRGDLKAVSVQRVVTF